MSRIKQTIRSATEDDLDTIAYIHLNAYSKRHFTTRLNPNTLASYYRLFLSDGSKTIVLSENIDGGGEKIVGFAVFGRKLGLKIKQFKKLNRKDIIKASIFHPFEAAQKIAFRTWAQITEKPVKDEADFILLSIAANKPNSGVGGALLDEFINSAHEEGVRKIGLYVNIDNIIAINSYIKRGFLFRHLYGGQFYMERHV